MNRLAWTRRHLPQCQVPTPLISQPGDRYSIRTQPEHPSQFPVLQYSIFNSRGNPKYTRILTISVHVGQKKASYDYVMWTRKAKIQLVTKRKSWSSVSHPTHTYLPDLTSGVWAAAPCSCFFTSTSIEALHGLGLGFGSRPHHWRFPSCCPCVASHGSSL